MADYVCMYVCMHVCMSPVDRCARLWMPSDPHEQLEATGGSMLEPSSISEPPGAAAAAAVGRAMEPRARCRVAVEGAALGLLILSAGVQR